MKKLPSDTDGGAKALSKERIVETAIQILDAEGEKALTFRALTTRLATGNGAIYWYVADKRALLAAAADHIIAGVLREVGEHAAPRESIRALAGGLFDASERHRWMPGQLVGNPLEGALLQVFEAIGQRLHEMGVPEALQFAAASALLHYIFGATLQNISNASRAPEGGDRDVLLAAAADEWLKLDPAKYAFIHRVAAQLAQHDDREQFLTGIDLILNGAAASQSDEHPR